MRRWYDAWMFLVMLLELFFLPAQCWSRGWSANVSMVAMTALLNIPLMLTELTRVDRSLLWQLVLSFEYWWLIANRLAMAAAGLALSAVGAYGSADSSEWTSDVCFQILWLSCSRDSCMDAHGRSQHSV